MFGKDGLPIPSADQCAAFLRAHSTYLSTGKTVYPYVNSSRAIEQVNNAAADLLEAKGLVEAAKRESALLSALQGIVGRWHANKGVVEEEFITQAHEALALHRQHRIG